MSVFLISKTYKIAFGVEYNGNKYYGWQRQKKEGIQEKLEEAISKVANESISISCAGRTDAGVHSIGQVVHFKTSVVRKDNSWILGVNANLPDDIAINWVKNVPSNFHARFSAIARRYHYIIYNQSFRPAIFNKLVTHHYETLDANRMHRAAQYLVGENDFTSFRSSQCCSRTPWRNVKHILVNRSGPYVIVDIKANAFVRYMVRNIVGSLIEVGTGRKQEEWIAELLKAKDRRLAPAKAKANGLYLSSVDYPEHFRIPEPPKNCLWMDKKSFRCDF